MGIETAATWKIKKTHGNKETFTQPHSIHVQESVCVFSLCQSFLSDFNQKLKWVDKFLEEVGVEFHENRFGGFGITCWEKTPIIKLNSVHPQMSYSNSEVRHPRCVWGKFSQKHNYEYMAKWWCLLAIENYVFRPIATIIRFWQLSCYKSYILNG